MMCEPPQLRPPRWGFGFYQSPFPGLRDIRGLTSLHPGLAWKRAVGTENRRVSSRISSPMWFSVLTSRMGSLSLGEAGQVHIDSPTRERQSHDMRRTHHDLP